MEQATAPVVSEELLLGGEVNCGKLLFKDFCSNLSKIEKLRTCREKMSHLFNKGLHEQLLHASIKQSVFPLLRLILPPNDGTRKKYGLKQAAVAATYIDALQLNPTSVDAKRLKFWKDPSKLGSEIAKKTSGELGEVIQYVLSKRISVENSTCTLGDVNNLLDELAATSGVDQTTIIRDKILNRFSPAEQKWLMRIVFQDLKIGLKYENVLKELDPQCLSRYNECTDLRLMCNELANNRLTVSGVSHGISLFTCFQPMLAKGFTNSGQINEVENAMKKHPFCMDLKLDGERMLCHVSKKNGEDGKGVFWSRNGTDYSTTYRSLLDDVISNVQCEACVLDGEVCSWDDNSQRFIKFGNNRTVARLEQENDASGVRLVYILFDIIYLEGLRDSNGKLLKREQWRGLIDYEKTIPGGLQALQAEETKEACRLAHSRPNPTSSAGDILHMPLLARRALLAQAIQRVPNRIQSIRSVSVYTSNIPDRKRQIEHFFNQVSTEGEEGLVVKDLLSPYTLGIKSRQLMHWVKMKPEYSDMTRDLDLIILGAYYGEGKSMRGKGLSTFLCGVKDTSSEALHPSSGGSSSSSSSSSGSSCSSDDNSLKQDKFKSICKVGTGYSFEQLEELRVKLGAVAQEWDKSNRHYIPPHFCPWRIGKLDDIPDVWIPPEHSIIVELKCAELVTSTQFSAGVTCRFPRLRHIRYDKNVCEVMTTTDLKEVIERPRMNVAEAASRGVTGSKKKKRVTIPSGGRADSRRGRGLFLHGHVPDGFLVSKPTGKMDSVIFQGKIFCIIESSFSLHASCFKTKGDSDSLLLRYANKKNHFKLTRKQVIDVVQCNGGDVVANPQPNCFVIVGDKRTLQIKGLIDAGKNDVLSFQYIVDSINGFIGNEDGNPNPTHFLGYTPETRSLFSGMFDEFGDSFTEDSDESQLRTIFNRLDDTINSYERKRKSTLNNEKKTKKSKKSSESMTDMDIDMERMDTRVEETLQLSRSLENQNWREIIRNDALEDSDYAGILDDNEWNIFWRSNTVLYVDIFDELGSIGSSSGSSTRTEGFESFMDKVCGRTIETHQVAQESSSSSSSSSSSLFRSKESTSSIPQTLSPNSTRLRSVVTQLLLRGATISPVLNEQVTHLVVDFENNYSIERERALQCRLRELRLHSDYRFEKRIVNTQWIVDCIAQEMLITPTEAHLVQWRTKEK